MSVLVLGLGVGLGVVLVLVVSERNYVATHKTAIAVAVGEATLRGDTARRREFLCKFWSSR